MEFTLSFLELIGKGSCASVYKATTGNSCSLMAVKVISKSYINENSKNQSRFLREVDCMKKLDHPNILKLHEVIDSQNAMHLVLDYLPGGDLLSYCCMTPQPNLSEPDVKQFIRQLLVTLVYMHSKGIVHRDLKLENILLQDKSGFDNFKIADFGFAIDHTRDTMLSKCGSPGYIAPEIFKDQTYDEKVDIFSVGVICYIMLYGERPFKGKSVRRILKSNESGVCSFPSKHSRKVSIQATRFLKKLLSAVDERPTAQQALTLPWLSAIDRLETVSTPSNLLTQKRPLISQVRLRLAKFEGSLSGTPLKLSEGQQEKLRRLPNRHTKVGDDSILNSPQNEYKQIAAFGIDEPSLCVEKTIELKDISMDIRKVRQQLKIEGQYAEMGLNFQSLGKRFRRQHQNYVSKPKMV